ncbi:hypothetical protein INT46_010337 [Mucor plumbeus]|uniref:Uncharacterized protein n=1 Tax=Mucor plumbeus TaxID=97098 RepID=A0A8H7R2X9_9FUNG|nr:hypothetical protein INT46_010337 [Mucor plumbeus]
MPIGNAYERIQKNPPRTYNKGKTKETIETAENTVLSKFEWSMNTCGLSNNISFSDYLLELLTEENGRLILMYKRIKVDNKLLDVTGSGALREIIRRIQQMEQSCLKFNELSSILALVPYHVPKARKIPFPTEEETALVSEPIPVSSTAVVTNHLSTSSIRAHNKGKKRAIDDVILDTDPERPSQVAKSGEM